MRKFGESIVRFLKSEDGPTAVEYAVMLALVVAIVISVVAVIGTKTKGKFDEFQQVFPEGGAG